MDRTGSGPHFGDFEPMLRVRWRAGRGFGNLESWQVCCLCLGRVGARVCEACGCVVIVMMMMMMVMMMMMTMIMGGRLNGGSW